MATIYWQTCTGGTHTPNQFRHPEKGRQQHGVHVPQPLGPVKNQVKALFFKALLSYDTFEEMDKGCHGSTGRIAGKLVLQGR